MLPRCAVRSYRTLSPLPDHYMLWSGGLLSAALSVGSRPPGVTWHPALWSPDFPPLSSVGHCRRAIVPGQLPVPLSPTRLEIKSAHSYGLLADNF